MENIRIKNEKNRVLFIRDGYALLSLHWKEADEARIALRYVMRGNLSIEQGSSYIYYGTNCHLHIVSDKNNTLLNISNKHGTLLFSLPQNIWQTVFNAITASCRSAESEEPAVIEQQIEDQALLQRTGIIPAGVTNNRKIQKEAMKEAHWNHKIRKYVAPSVKVNVPLGVPSVINNTTPVDRVDNIINRGSDYERKELRRLLAGGS